MKVPLKVTDLFNDAINQSVHIQSYLESLLWFFTVKETKLKKYRKFSCHMEKIQVFNTSCPDHYNNLLVVSSNPYPVLPHYCRKVS